MAYGDATSLVSAALSTAAATTALTLPSAVPPKSTVLVGYSDNANGTATAADSLGNTYPVVIQRSGSGSAGLLSFHAPDGLASGTVITITHSVSIARARVGWVGYFAGYGVVDRTSSNNANNSAAWNSGTTAATQFANEVAIGLLGHQNTGGNNNLTGSTPAMTELLDHTTTRALVVAHASAIANATTVRAQGTMAGIGNYAAVVATFREVADISVAQTTETDTAQTLRQPIRVNQATETDTAQPISQPGRINQAFETDTARAISQPIRTGQASETDTAGAITARKTRAIGQASETDTAGVVVRSGQTIVIGQATETDTARTIARLLVNRASETDTAGAVTGHVGTPIYPEFIPSVGILVFDPALVDGRQLEPDFWTESPTVFEPALAGPQTINPDFFTNSSTVFDPHLIAGTFLYPDFFTDSPTVFSPAISAAQPLRPAFFTDPPVVFSPHLIIGQFLYPAAGPVGTPTVFSPALIPGIFLYPERVESGITIYSPAIAHGQTIAPDFFTDSPTVYDPAIAHGQVLAPDFWTDSITVFDPALAHVSPPPPDPDVIPDPESQYTRMGLRTGR